MSKVEMMIDETLDVVARPFIDRVLLAAYAAKGSSE